MKHIPGWAIGWYFIPILNLWKPYQALKEAFLASRHPDSQYPKGTILLGVWWVIHLLAGFFGQAIFQMAMDLGEDPTISQLIVLNGVQIAGDFIGIFLNIATLVIVLRFARFQREADEKRSEDFVSDQMSQDW